MRCFACICSALLLSAATLIPAESSGPTSSPGYVLGPGDQLSLAVENLNDDFTNKNFRIDLSGDINLPLAGSVHAAGLSIHEFEVQVQQRLERYVKESKVVATVTEFNSQPVSVLGAVNNAGVKQVAGRKTLFEILSIAGGLRPDAGSSIKITRRLDRGAIPLTDAQMDPTGQFSVASVSVKAILNATDPAQNIVILPGDVISVAKADVVYAVGSVIKPGGFPLNQEETLSALQVLSLAGGLTRTAALDKAEILHSTDQSSKPIEIPVNLKRIMAGKASDLQLRPNDILFVPNNGVKSASFRALDAVITAATYGRIY
jgi:polysaccharide export outer membrane protein